MPGRMIFLYGPPAVGKLTVARLVAERSGFKVMHNHLTIDAVTPILEFGTPAFNHVVHRFRVELIQGAASAGVDLVCTFVYATGDERVVDELVAPYRGAVHFVQLVATHDELRRRVVDESRQAHGKIRDVEMLDDVLDRHECFLPIAGRDGLSIDMESTTAERAADLILAGLP